MKKRSRLLVVALPALVVLLGLTVYEYGYVAVKEDLKAVKEQEIVKMRTLEKYINLIAEKPYQEKMLAELRERRKADDSKIIEGQTPSLSAAALQETVKGIITSKGGSISSERVEKPEDYGKFRMINVTIDAVIPDARSLSDILYGIETRTPYLVVKEVDTRVRNFREPRELMAKLRISALTVRR
jgi:hypothetical protein